MSRKCPECLTVLSVTQSHIVHVCEDCGCRSLHFSHFEGVAPEILIKRFKNEMEKNAASDKFSCAECKKPMVKAEINTGRERVEIDACQDCQLVWFDHMELESFVKNLDQEDTLAIPQEIQKSLNEVGYVNGKAVPNYMSFRFAMDQFSVVTVANYQNTPKKAWKWLAALLGLPVESQNRLAHAPLITYSLISLCILVYIAELFFPTFLIGQGGFYANDTTRHFGMTVITSAFLHGSFWHLVSNMYFLWVFGDNCEDSLGKSSFISLFASGQIIGSLFYALGTAEANVPQVGASAAISALICYYVVRFPSVQFAKYILFFFWIKFPAIAYVGFWGILQVIGSYNQVSQFTEVSYLAHLGGMFAGVLFGLLARNNLIDKKY